MKNKEQQTPFLQKEGDLPTILKKQAGRGKTKK